MRSVQQGDAVHVQVVPGTWVEAVVSYADPKSQQYIVTTREHGAYSFTRGPHPDLKPKAGRP